MNQTRPSVLAAVIPIARCRLPFFSASVERFWASHWIPRWATQHRERGEVPQKGEIGEHEHNRGGGQHQ